MARLLLFVMLFPVFLAAQAPERLILNLTADPAHSMAVTWRTAAEVAHPYVKVSVNAVWTTLDSSARTIAATSEKVLLDSVTVVYHHSAILDRLTPNTQYAYKAGGDEQWSEWNQFTTASEKPQPFDFVFFGDPQNDVKQYVSRIFRAGYAKSPQARFWLFSGDLLNIPMEDAYWGELFSAAGFIPSLMPSIMVPGSHEYAAKRKDGRKYSGFTRLWDQHFTLPENGVAGLEERSYCVDYQGVRFVMLDGQTQLPEQARWLDSVLAHNPNRWTVLTVHQPFFSMGRNRDERATRSAFMAAVDKYAVDLVLTGHDHVYARSRRLVNGSVVPGQKKGTVYVVSNCGAKAYTLSPTYQALMARTGTDRQLFQIISFNGRRLQYRSYDASGTLFDTFDLTK